MISFATVAAMQAYRATMPNNSGLHVSPTAEQEEFLTSLDAGEVQPIIEADEDCISEHLEEDGTVESARAAFRKGAASRRAFYIAVREFVNDPATWQALDDQDKGPDFEKIADGLRAEGIEIKHEAPTG